MDHEVLVSKKMQKNNVDDDMMKHILAHMYYSMLVLSLVGDIPSFLEMLRKGQN